MLIPVMATLLASEPSQIPGIWGVLAKFAGATDPTTRLAAFGGAIFCFVAAKGIVQALNTAFISWIDGRAGNDIRAALSLQLLTVGFPFFLREERARLVNILATESWRVSDALRTRFRILVDAVFCPRLYIIAIDPQLEAHA